MRLVRNVATNLLAGMVNVRQAYIQGIDTSYLLPTALATPLVKGASLGVVPNTASGQGLPVPVGPQLCCTRRYQVNFALGLFTQDKLIPTKFMASQLAIEITLENANSCIYSVENAGVPYGVPPTYGLSNVNLIPEILEFDVNFCLCNFRHLTVPFDFTNN